MLLNDVVGKGSEVGINRHAHPGHFGDFFKDGGIVHRLFGVRSPRKRAVPADQNHLAFGGIQCFVKASAFSGAVLQFVRQSDGAGD